MSAAEATTAAYRNDRNWPRRRLRLTPAWT